MDAQGEPPSVFCFNSIIQAWSAAGNVAKAEEWLRNALEREVDVSGNSFSSFILASVRAGEVRKADDWLADMVKKGLTSASSHNAVAAAWTRQGEQGRADAVRRRLQVANQRR
jgi:pentatricopeptide repeat protein